MAFSRVAPRPASRYEHWDVAYVVLSFKEVYGAHSVVTGPGVSVVVSPGLFLNLEIMDIQKEFDKITEHVQQAKKHHDYSRSNMTAVKSDEEIEMCLFQAIKAMDKLKHLVKEIDPDRFGPIITKSLREQDINTNRLHCCNICGRTRCTSDHK